MMGVPEETQSGGQKRRRTPPRKSPCSCPPWGPQPSLLALVGGQPSPHPPKHRGGCPPSCQVPVSHREQRLLPGHSPWGRGLAPVPHDHNPEWGLSTPSPGAQALLICRTLLALGPHNPLPQAPEHPSQMVPSPAPPGTPPLASLQPVPPFSPLENPSKETRPPFSPATSRTPPQLRLASQSPQHHPGWQGTTKAFSSAAMFLCPALRLWGQPDPPSDLAAALRLPSCHGCATCSLPGRGEQHL